MILLADSGSTKTDWCIAENNSIQKRISRGAPTLFPDSGRDRTGDSLRTGSSNGRFSDRQDLFLRSRMCVSRKKRNHPGRIGRPLSYGRNRDQQRHAGRCKGTLSAIGRNRLHFGNRIQLLLLRRETDLQQRFAIGIHSRRRRQRSRFGPAVGGRLSEKSTALPAEGKISRTVRSDPSHYLGTRLQTPLPQPFSGQSIAVYRREPPDSRNPTYRIGRIYRLFPAATSCNTTAMLSFRSTSPGSIAY